MKYRDGKEAAEAARAALEAEADRLEPVFRRVGKHSVFRSRELTAAVDTLMGHLIACACASAYDAGVAGEYDDFDARTLKAVRDFLAAATALAFNRGAEEGLKVGAQEAALKELLPALDDIGFDD